MKTINTQSGGKTTSFDITNIVWDTEVDGKTVKVKLPSEVRIIIGLNEVNDAGSQLYEMLEDLLSAEYGFCVSDCSIQLD